MRGRRSVAGPGAAPGAARHSCLQGPIEVGDEVGEAFQADRKAYHVRPGAGRLALTQALRPGEIQGFDAALRTLDQLRAEGASGA